MLNFTCTNSEHSVIHKVTIIEAKGNEDVLYHFWDFGIKPTFLIVQVPKNTKVKLDCTRFLNNETNSITFTSKPLFMFGVMLNKVTKKMKTFKVLVRRYIIIAVALGV